VGWGGWGDQVWVSEKEIHFTASTARTPKLLHCQADQAVECG
jgi:hypothetical protein